LIKAPEPLQLILDKEGYDVREVNRLLLTVSETCDTLSLNNRNPVVHHLVEHSWRVTDRGNWLAGVIEGLNQRNRIGIVDEIPHRTVATWVEYGVEIFCIHI